MVSERQKQAYEMPAPARKITEDLRARALRRVDGQLVPSVTKDTEIRGFALVVTTRRTFWCLFFQPKGVNLTTGRRWGGGVRRELGDAFATSIADAPLSRAQRPRHAFSQGHDPHRPGDGLQSFGSGRARGSADNALRCSRWLSRGPSWPAASPARRRAVS